jgi:hypothetical protein
MSLQISNFKILKFLRQTLSLFPEQSTLGRVFIYHIFSSIGSVFTPENICVVHLQVTDTKTLRCIGDLRIGILLSAQLESLQ